MSIERKDDASAAPGAETARAAHVMSIARTFRRFGYEAASLGILGQETGLGRSSLYHHFPGGKRVMADAVLEMAGQFVRGDVMPLLAMNAARKDNVEAFLAMLSDYYEGGRTACLYGVFTLHDAPADIRMQVERLTADWLSMLEADLARNGAAEPAEDAKRILRAIQGGLMLTQATGDPACFEQALDDIRDMLL